jgi:hypothetical protein
LGSEAAPGAPLGPIDGAAIAGWLLDDLEHQPLPQPVPRHPLDRGQPGSRTDVVRPRRLQ